MNRKAGTEAGGDVGVDVSAITWLFIKDTGMPRCLYALFSLIAPISLPIQGFILSEHPGGYIHSCCFSSSNSWESRP